MKWYEDPIYIKMCEKAEEIQKLRNTVSFIDKAVGEYPAGKYKLMEVEDMFFTEGKGVHISFGIAYPNSIWLPRQDQLQEMLVTFVVDSSPYKLHLALTRWLECEVGLPPPYTSMEQLWLAFVMKEKYNKVWNKEEWNNE